MRLDRLETLAQKLEAGAPGVAFCLGAPLSTIEQGLGPDADPFDHAPIRHERDLKGLALDDVACGIDGYAIFLFSDHVFLYPDPFHDPWAQQNLTKSACALLGLPWTNPDVGHQLFYASMMPFEATPQIAAQAVRRVMVGQYPW